MYVREVDIDGSLNWLMASFIYQHGKKDRRCRLYHFSVVPVK